MLLPPFITHMKIRFMNHENKNRVSDAQESVKKPVGRPLLLEQDVEDKVKAIVCGIRDAGGVINNSTVIGIIKGVIKDSDSNLLLENGGSIEVDKPMANVS